MALENIDQPAKVFARLQDLAKQSGTHVSWSAPNTTDLVASNGLEKKPRTSPPKKLPWISEEEKNVESNCFYTLSSEGCGTQVYCEAFDSEPYKWKRRFFKDAKECFGAYESPTVSTKPSKVATSGKTT
ncbi:hypothetical protein QQS21_003156 [Conoideocrella luteorostrata]|uniref:Uncharacterized protein n=1 Tax=Conoideocrella luteorostrata TaxID=1105319 RepID=A0AAJ0CWX0_9HYPO|nr:hypothetical protein QQS21_003156 [Conoideocrella luteorostrata]